MTRSVPKGLLYHQWLRCYWQQNLASRFNFCRKKKLTIYTQALQQTQRASPCCLLVRQTRRVMTTSCIKYWWFPKICSCWNKNTEEPTWLPMSILRTPTVAPNATSEQQHASNSILTALMQPLSTSKPLQVTQWDVNVFPPFFQHAAVPMDHPDQVTHPQPAVTASTARALRCARLETSLGRRDMDTVGTTKLVAVEAGLFHHSFQLFWY